MNLVTDIQRCEDCRWRGFTIARIASVIFWAVYLFAATMLVRVLTMPVIAGVLVFVFLVNSLVPLIDRCRQCGGKRIVVERR